MVSWFIIWETWRGVLTRKENNGEKWNGKPQIRDTMQTGEAARSLWKMGEDIYIERTALGKGKTLQAKGGI